MSGEKFFEPAEYNERAAASGEDKVWWTEALVAAQLANPWFDAEDPGAADILIHDVQDWRGVVPSREAYWWVTNRASAIAAYEDFTAESEEKAFLETRRREHRSEGNGGSEMSENYVPKTEAELDALAYKEVSQWRDENGELLDEAGREQAVAGLRAARERFAAEYARLESETPEDDARWEGEGGHVLAEDPEISPRVRRNRQIEQRMTEITEQLLEGESNA